MQALRTPFRSGMDKLLPSNRLREEEERKIMTRLIKFLSITAFAMAMTIAASSASGPALPRLGSDSSYLLTIQATAVEKHYLTVIQDPKTLKNVVEVEPMYDDQYGKWIVYIRPMPGAEVEVE